MAVNLTPLHDRVIVKRIEEKENRKGRHHQPGLGEGKAMEGEVIAVGAGSAKRAN